MRELTRLLQARRPDAGRWHGAANLDSVREVIDRRLARLSQSCIRMLTVAALDGTTLRPWLLARVLGDDANLPALIEEAAAARVAVAEGDDTEKARKTVTARIHRALRILDVHHPALAAHLRDALHTGTTCSYHPAHPIDWQQ